LLNECVDLFGASSLFNLALALLYLRKMLNQLLLLRALLLLSVVASFELYSSDTGICAKDLEEYCGITSNPDTIQSLYDSRSCLRRNRQLLTKECVNYLELEKPSIVDSCFIEMKSYCLKVNPGAYRVHNCLLSVPSTDLSQNCKIALAYDQQILQESSSSSSSSVSDVFSSIPSSSSLRQQQQQPSEAHFWSSMSSYLLLLTQEIKDNQQKILSSYLFSNGLSSETTHLRGSLYFLEHSFSDDDNSNHKELSKGVAGETDDKADDKEGNGDEFDTTNRHPTDDSTVTAAVDDDDDDTNNDDYLKQLKESILAAAGASHRINEDLSLDQYEEMIKDTIVESDITSSQ
jgi:hypothetical protein